MLHRPLTAATQTLPIPSSMVNYQLHELSHRQPLGEFTASNMMDFNTLLPKKGACWSETSVSALCHLQAVTDQCQIMETPTKKHQD